MFSGHDDNIWPFLTSFGLSNTDCLQKKYEEKYIKKSKNVEKEDNFCRLAPGFASSFLFELTFDQQSNQYLVRVKYDGKVLDLKSRCPDAVNNTYCPFKSFKAFLEKDFILAETEYKKVCRPHKLDTNTVVVWKSVTSWFVYAILLLLVLVIMLTFKLKKLSDDAYIHGLIQNEREKKYGPKRDVSREIGGNVDLQRNQKKRNQVLDDDDDEELDETFEDDVNY